MRLLCPKASALAVALITLVSVSGCGSNPSGPLNPELSGVWISPSVDTYSKFSLQERGDSISGTLSGCFAGGPTCDTFLVSGSADLPHVVLSWVEGGVRHTFDATLSDDQLTLTGTYDSGPNSDTYHRQQPISGRTLALVN